MTPDGKFFKQIDGVAMGSPLGPTFANFYEIFGRNYFL